MTRAEILAQYDVRTGRIVSPGKFAGEPVWVPYFWELLLDGEGEEQEDGWIDFGIEPEDIEEFPELAGAEKIGIYEREDGFVEGVLIGRRKAQEGV